MKKLLLFILAGIVATGLSAQTESSAYKSVIEKFTIYYNGNQADSIFMQFDENMQKILPIEKTRDFITGLKQKLGSINKKEFIKYKSTFAVYKTYFDQGIFAINISIDSKTKINGLSVSQYIPDNFSKMERNISGLILPFNDEWTVLWGGDTEGQNHHVNVIAQKNAFDFLITDSAGTSYKNTGENNEDYYCFGQKIIAPCAGEIVLAVDGIKDNKPGEMNSFFTPGNTVIIKTENNEYIYFCHFKQHSVAVKEGQKVKQGELLGLCGNSGNSSEAHLHFHIQNTEDYNVATGVKCYFTSIIADNETKQDYSPVKNNKIKNILH